MSREKTIASMEEILIVRKHMQQKNNHFMNTLFISKVLKHQHYWIVFIQHHLVQKTHELVFLTSLKGCVQSIKVF
jgi:hypothetical protein